MNKKIDVDSLSADITRDMAFSKLEKTLPPKLRYRFYKWLKQFGHHAKAPTPQVQQTVQKAMNHVKAIRELKKNEVLTSLYDNGCIRMDFGAEVDKKVKDAAMGWAKKRGLKAMEASIEKSDGASSHIIFGANVKPQGVCVKYSKHSV